MISTLPAVGRPVGGTNIAREIFTSTRLSTHRTWHGSRRPRHRTGTRGRNGRRGDRCRRPRHGTGAGPRHGTGTRFRRWHGVRRDRGDGRSRLDRRNSGARCYRVGHGYPLDPTIGTSAIQRYTARYGRASHMRLPDTAHIRFAPAALVGRTQDVSFDPLHELGDGGSDDLGAGANDPVIPGNRAQREVADERLRCFKL